MVQILIGSRRVLNEPNNPAKNTNKNCLTVVIIALRSSLELLSKFSGLWLMFMHFLISIYARNNRYIIWEKINIGLNISNMPEGRFWKEWNLWGIKMTKTGIKVILITWRCYSSNTNIHKSRFMIYIHNADINNLYILKICYNYGVITLLIFIVFQVSYYL